MFSRFEHDFSLSNAQDFDTSHYTEADKAKYKGFVIQSLRKYISNKRVNGKRIALTVAINPNDIFHWGDGMSIRVVDDSSAIMKVADKVGARKASFNAEFLFGGGVFSYIPRDKLNSHVALSIEPQSLQGKALRVKKQSTMLSPIWPKRKKIKYLENKKLLVWVRR